MRNSALHYWQHCDFDALQNSKFASQQRIQTVLITLTLVFPPQPILWVYLLVAKNTTPVGNSPKLRFLATVYSLEAAKTGFNTTAKYEGYNGKNYSLDKLGFF